MPLTRTQLVEATAEASFTYADEPVKLRFYRKRLTFEWGVAYDARVEEIKQIPAQVRAGTLTIDAANTHYEAHLAWLAGEVVRLVAWWDALEEPGGPMIPLTVESLAALHEPQLLTAMINACLGAVSPGEVKAAPKSNRSARRSR